MKVNRMTNAAMIAAVAILAAPALEAKPGKGNQGGGKPAKAQKDFKKAAKAREKAVKKPQKQQQKAQKQQAKQRKKSYSSSELADWRFRENEQERVRRYFGNYRNNEHGLPPGLAKNLRRGKPLPPGWQKKLNRGYVFNDDWWGALTPVPYDAVPGFERYPDTGLYLYNDRIIRVYEPRREVIDVVVVPSISLRLR